MILTINQIQFYKEKAKVEIDRDIYSISIGYYDVIINGHWSIERNEKNNILKEIVTAIETYCSRDNIEWEYQSEYTAWCD